MARVVRNQLTTRKVRSLGPGQHTDGGGLMLRVHPSGGKSWVLRLTIEGTRRHFGLGSYPEVGLAEARDRAAEMRQRARSGLDPVPEPEARTETPSFAEVAKDVIELRSPTWTSERHATQWRESLRLHVLPHIGSTPVDEIRTEHMLSLLRPIWTEKAETARRVRQRCGVVFDYAIASGWRADNPCLGLANALPSQSRQRRHHPALPYDEVPDAVNAILDSSSRPATKLALIFAILTASRTGSVRLATSDEIDMDSGLWIVPGEHMKMRRPHRVPLSSGALDVLEEAKALADQSGLIFPGSRGRPLSNMALTMLLRRSGYDHVVPHGFRASFRTWALEQTDAPWAVAEAALAHNLGGGEVVAYVRGDLFERRRELMQTWSDYVLRAD